MSGSGNRARIAVVTGSRAEFGLLLPVIRALRAQSTLDTRIIACGSHLLEPARTIEEVRREVGVDATVEMQRPGELGRLADGAAVGRGIEGMSRAFEQMTPQCVLVLGDRIEAFSAASAASIGGIAVAHIHGGDRAEGIADEAMRHAITKLSHLHLAATPASAARIVRMGEEPSFVKIVGSPAIDGLADVRAMSDSDAAGLGDPSIVVLLHPSGLTPDQERTVARNTLDGVASRLNGRSALCLTPNFDAGREVIAHEVHSAAERYGWRVQDHLARASFLALLARLAQSTDGLLVGNSSAGLIECAALRLPVVNVGPRQGGRERPDNVVDALGTSTAEIGVAIDKARRVDRSRLEHPYGDGRSGEKIALAIAETDFSSPDLLRKRCAF